MKYLYDTHVHTKEVSCCGASSAAKQVRAFKKKGYTGIIITDHLVRGYSNCDESLPWEERVRFHLSGYEKAKKEGDLCGLDVFLGWEYTSRETRDGVDFLTYGLDAKFLLAYPDLVDLKIEEYCYLVRKHNGYIAQAHPFRNVAVLGMEAGPVSPMLIDGIEVYNAGRSESINAPAFEFAMKHNLFIQAGSDSHEESYPLNPCGIALGKKAESIFDIIEAIKSRTVTIIRP